MQKKRKEMDDCSADGVGRGKFGGRIRSSDDCSGFFHPRQSLAQHPAHTELTIIIQPTDKGNITLKYFGSNIWTPRKKRRGPSVVCLSV